MDSRSRSPHMRSAKLPLFQPYAPTPIFWDRWNAYDIYRIFGLWGGATWVNEWHPYTIGIGFDGATRVNKWHPYIIGTGFDGATRVNKWHPYTIDNCQMNMNITIVQSTC
jgi:hypothetical protein